VQWHKSHCPQCGTTLLPHLNIPHKRASIGSLPGATAAVCRMRCPLLLLFALLLLLLLVLYSSNG
jgi:prepilin signal peptidase PulO-like enzyme (type II secretory pathway)